MTLNLFTFYTKVYHVSQNHFYSDKNHTTSLSNLKYYLYTGILR